MRNGNGSALSALVLGACVAAGAAAGGWFVGRGVARFKTDSRTVTVKGLVERDVKADRAIWRLELRRASDDLRDAHARLAADRQAVVEFLAGRGFGEAEVERLPTTTVDTLAREYGQPSDKGLRYVASTAIVLETANVDGVRSALGATDALLERGVVLGGGEGGRANPRYIVTRFNDLRPELLAEATRNARTMAQQFAADSGSTVGGIRSANQGMIQIFGSEGNDESGEFSPTSTPTKKIRLVSTFEFELR